MLTHRDRECVALQGKNLKPLSLKFDALQLQELSKNRALGLFQETAKMPRLCARIAKNKNFISVFWISQFSGGRSGRQPNTQHSGQRLHRLLGL